MVKLIQYNTKTIEFWIKKYFVVVVVSLQGRVTLNGRGKILGSPPHIVSQSPYQQQNKNKKREK